MLSLARVVASHPESHAVDIVFMDDGRRVAGVQVMAGVAGGNLGFTDLPSPDLTTPGDPYATGNTGTRDIYAVVSFLRGAPLVLGFLFPQVAQCLFSDKDRMIYRHASDVYVTIDKDGNTEVSHPSGTFLRIGTDPAHEDLTGKDYDQRWAINKNTDKAVHVHLQVANAGSVVASLAVDPSGNVVESNVGNLSATVGGNVTANVTGTTTVTSGGNITLNAPTVTLNAPSGIVLNGPLTQGKGSNGGACTMQGPLTVTNDVTAGGISLMTHKHTGVQPGGGQTGTPV